MRVGSFVLRHHGAMLQALTEGNVPLAYSYWYDWVEYDAGPRYTEQFTLGGWP